MTTDLTQSITALVADGRKESAQCRALFEELHNACYSKLLRFILSRLDRGGKHEAEDIANDVVMKGWKNLHQLRGQPEAWLFGIARRAISDWHRAWRRWPSLLPEHADFAAAPEALDHEFAGPLKEFADALSDLRQMLAELALHVPPHAGGRGRVSDRDKFAHLIDKLRRAADDAAQWLDKCGPDAKAGD